MGKGISHDRCAACSGEMEPSERYPNRLCKSCMALVTDADGKPVVFYKQEMSGGVCGYYSDTNQPYAEGFYFLNGKRYRVDEARFGGIVMMPV
jgi:hypothetical protein